MCSRPLITSLFLPLLPRLPLPQTLPQWNQQIWRSGRAWAVPCPWAVGFCGRTRRGFCATSGVWVLSSCSRAISTRGTRPSTPSTLWHAKTTESTSARSPMRLEPGDVSSTSPVRREGCNQSVLSLINQSINQPKLVNQSPCQLGSYPASQM